MALIRVGVIFIVLTTALGSDDINLQLQGNVQASGMSKYLTVTNKTEKMVQEIKDMLLGFCAYGETKNTLLILKQERQEMISEMANLTQSILKSMKQLEETISNRRKDTNDISKTCGGKAYDCTDLKNKNCTDGVYQLNPDGMTAFNAYCDFSTDTGGWTVIQRRQNGTTDFYRSWQDYKDGFGNVENEYWLGNEKIFQLTSKAQYELRIELQDWNGDKRYAVYRPFSLSNEASSYTLSIGSYSGNAGDGLSYNKGHPFSTKDKGTKTACAQAAVGAWWYDSCTYSNLNGEYLRGKFYGDNHRGVLWYAWTGWNYSLKSSVMMIRRY